MAKEKFVKAIKYDICGTLCKEDDGDYFIRVTDGENYEDYPLEDILEDMIDKQISLKCESDIV